LNTKGKQTIHLDGGNANLTMGGNGAEADIGLRNAKGRQTVHIDGGEGNLSIGGASADGDIVVLDHKGLQTIHLDGGEGNATLGGNGHDGDIMLTTSNGVTRVELEAHSGALRAMNKSGDTTVEIIGDSGEIRVKGKAVKAADYVFADGYDLAPLPDVARFISANGHLPGVPRGSDLEAAGVPLTRFTMQLLEKIEELTLHAIEQDRRIAVLEEALSDGRQQRKARRHS
ncbi:MAG: hypothetical protein AAFY27_05865, partial [Pseudomonadota bacterium]